MKTMNRNTKASYQARWTVRTSVLASRAAVFRVWTHLWAELSSALRVLGTLGLTPEPIPILIGVKNELGSPVPIQEAL